MPARRRNGIDLSGEPFTRISPSNDSMSSGLASRRSAAISKSCWRASSAAALTARPTVNSVLLPALMPANGDVLVSPVATLTISKGSPSSSAAICANDVFVPEMSFAPTRTLTVPSPFSSTCALAGCRPPSQPPIASPTPRAFPLPFCFVPRDFQRSLSRTASRHSFMPMRGYFTSVGIASPSETAFCMRTSSGSSCSSRAIMSIWLSIAKVTLCAPGARIAPTLTLLVSTS